MGSINCYHILFPPIFHQPVNASHVPSTLQPPRILAASRRPCWEKIIVAGGLESGNMMGKIGKKRSQSFKQTHLYGGFLQWVIMENPSINRWFGGTPISGNPHMYIYIYVCSIHNVYHIHIMSIHFAMSISGEICRTLSDEPFTIKDLVSGGTWLKISWVTHYVYKLITFHHL